MLEVAVQNHGGPEVLYLREAPVPDIGRDDVLIEVVAAGINRPDIAQRLGRYPVPEDANPTLGLEVSGRIVAKGSNVSALEEGDLVMALTHGGGYATYCRVDKGQVLAVPQGLSMIEAAAFPETAFTVEFNLMMRANLCKGETVLIHGGASGIGSHAIQRAKAAGATVVVTAGSSEKCHYCKSLGADHAVNYNGEWAEEVAAIAAGGLDVVLDMVGGDYLQSNIDLLRDDGRYVLISLLHGGAAQINLEPVLRRRLVLMGSTLRPLSSDRKSEIAAEIAASVLPIVAEGLLRPRVDRVFQLRDISAAHRYFESGRHMGKVVLSVGES